MREDEAGRHSERWGAAGGCGPEEEAREATSRALGGSGRLRAAGAPAVAKVAVSRPPPPPRALEVPYAYQCCSYRVCRGVFKALGRRTPQGPHPDDHDAPKRPLGLPADAAESHCE